MSEEIYYADATTLARRIASGDLSPIEVVRAHLDRIEAANPKLNAIVNLQAEQALERAQQAAPLQPSLPNTAAVCSCWSVKNFHATILASP